MTSKTMRIKMTKRIRRLIWWGREKKEKGKGKGKGRKRKEKKRKGRWGCSWRLRLSS